MFKVIRATKVIHMCAFQRLSREALRPTRTPSIHSHLEEANKAREIWRCVPGLEAAYRDNRHPNCRSIVELGIGRALLTCYNR